MKVEHMDLLEHEGKSLLARFGIRVPLGILVKNEEEAVQAALRLGVPIVLKSQVPAGGRGKAGAIIHAERSESAGEAFRTIMGIPVKGFLPRAVLVETSLAIEDEFYLAIALDRDLGLPVLLFNPKGGVDVESSIGSMARWPIRPDDGIISIMIHGIMDGIGDRGISEKEVREVLEGAWKLFWQLDCELLEINPLFLTSAGGLVAGDAKVTIDDDSLFRHPDLRALGSMEGTPFEIGCRESGFSGVDLGGEIAVIANGAGLTMAVLDEIVDHGLTGACFLDMGGTDDPAEVEKAITLASSKELLPGLKCVLVCIFGGLTKCDVVAAGIAAVSRKEEHPVPLVVRLRGVNEEMGREILISAGIKAHLAISDAIASVKKEAGK